MVNWKKELFRKCISKNLFIDTEGLYKMWISSQVFFKDFVDRCETICLKNGFLYKYFSRLLLADFRIATYLNTGSPQKYFMTKIILLKVH